MQASESVSQCSPQLAVLRGSRFEHADPKLRCSSLESQLVSVIDAKSVHGIWSCYLPDKIECIEKVPDRIVLALMTGHYRLHRRRFSRADFSFRGSGLQREGGQNDLTWKRNGYWYATLNTCKYVPNEWPHMGVRAYSSYSNDYPNVELYSGVDSGTNAEPDARSASDVEIRAEVDKEGEPDQGKRMQAGTRGVRRRHTTRPRIQPPHANHVEPGYEDNTRSRPSNRGITRHCKRV